MDDIRLDPAGSGGEFGHVKLNKKGSFKDFYKVGSILGEGAFGGGALGHVQIGSFQMGRQGDRVKSILVTTRCKLKSIFCVVSSNRTASA